ncbi:hypothetical protein [Clostridium thailandense]|uniref:hypothetical protein n=1 Tax=Clostridium thailandense TaxID=2794346 RepID=UPI0039892961
MYELISVQDYDITRLVKLRNLDSGTIEECFDDSAVVSGENFDFMEVGQKYECKIKLFGKVAEEANDKSVLCTIVDRNIIIGTQNMVKVIIKEDDYYIPQKKYQIILTKIYLSSIFRERT